MSASALPDKLPDTRGKIHLRQPLAPVTWFRVGGLADALFLPQDEDDLAQFLARLPPDIPVTVIGVGSNLLVRDGGIRGVVIRLGSTFAKSDAESGDRIRAGAGALDLAVARAARDASLAGLEFLSGIPGSVGGGLVMNAGLTAANSKTF